MDKRFMIKDYAKQEGLGAKTSKSEGCEKFDKEIYTIRIFFVITPCSWRDAPSSTSLRFMKLPFCDRLKVFAALLAALPALAADSGSGRENLLPNAQPTEGLYGWKVTTQENKGTVAVDHQVNRGDAPSIRIVNASAADTFFQQEVSVKPGMRYRLTAFIKTDNVVAPNNQGANLSIGGTYTRSESLSGTKSWKKVDFEFESGALDKMTLGCRLGGWYAPVSGTAWFSDLRLVEIGKSRKR
jgi:hypothetical protein